MGASSSISAHSSWPKIIQFLGYDPLTRLVTLGGQIAARRRELGLSLEKAAQLIGLDEGSLRRYELQQRLPRGQQLLKVQRFISPDVPAIR